MHAPILWVWKPTSAKTSIPGKIITQGAIHRELHGLSLMDHKTSPFKSGEWWTLPGPASLWDQLSPDDYHIISVLHEIFAFWAKKACIDMHLWQGWTSKENQTPPGFEDPDTVVLDLICNRIPDWEEMTIPMVKGE
jgi:hypothetical protein